MRREGFGLADRLTAAAVQRRMAEGLGGGEWCSGAVARADAVMLLTLTTALPVLCSAAIQVWCVLQHWQQLCCAARMLRLVRGAGWRWKREGDFVEARYDEARYISTDYEL